MKKKILLLFVLPIMLFSCKDAIEELETIGSFKSTFTGAITQQFDGQAAFVHSIRKTTQPNGSGLVITLTQGTSQDELIVLTLTSMATTGIEAGTYQFADNTTADVLFLPAYSLSTSNGVYIVNPNLTNSITVSSVKNLRIKGSFTLNMMTAAVTPELIKIEGTFDAAGTTVNQ